MSNPPDENRPTRNLRVAVFQSFEEENAAETTRRARLTTEERMAELAAIQARTWGPDWVSTPMIKKATWEKTPW